jgi:putative flippase GtrA
MWGLLKRYLKFAFSSLAGTLTDTLVLWLLSSFVFEKGYWGEYVLSPFVSFQCAVAVNYTISYFYVWKDRTRQRQNASPRKFFRLYALYDLSSSVVFLFRLGILVLIETFTGWDVVICNLGAMCFSGIVNFLINNMLIFGKKTLAPDPGK